MCFQNKNIFIHSSLSNRGLWKKEILLLSLNQSVTIDITAFISLLTESTVVILLVHLGI